MNKDYYLRLRKRYLPSKLNLLFILESPPVSGKYFYDETGATTEPLFRGIMKLLNYKPTPIKNKIADRANPDVMDTMIPKLDGAHPL